MYTFVEHCRTFAEQSSNTWVEYKDYMTKHSLRDSSVLFRFIIFHNDLRLEMGMNKTK